LGHGVCVKGAHRSERFPCR